MMTINEDDFDVDSLVLTNGFRHVTLVVDGVFSDYCEAIMQEYPWIHCHFKETSSVGQTPTTTNERPTSTNERPTTTNEGPTTTSEHPTTTSEDPMTTNEHPGTTNDDSTSRNERPTTRVQSQQI